MWQLVARGKIIVGVCFIFQYTTPLIIQESICTLGGFPQQRVGELGGLPSFPYQCEAPAALGSQAFFSIIIFFNV